MGLIKYIILFQINYSNCADKAVFKMIIVPDYILEQLICDVCHKYLSVGPVKIRDNKKICGRCIHKGAPAANSMYNIFIKIAIFKCINRFDGCSEVLSSKKVKQHEKVCIGKINKCPFNDVTVRMPTFQLLYHLKMEHREFFLQKPNLSMDQLGETKLFWYLNENILFFLYFINDGKKVCSKTFYVGNAFCAILQKYFLYYNTSFFANKTIVCQPVDQLDSDKKQLNELLTDSDVLSVSNIHFQFKCNEYSNITFLDLKTVTNSVVRKIKVNKCENWYKQKVFVSKCKTKLIKKIDDRKLIKINMECLYCGNIYCSAKYITSEGPIRHLICNYCWPMNEIAYENLEDVHLSNIDTFIGYLSFSCKWGCDSFHHVDHLLFHEDTCNRSPKSKCPLENCYFNGSFITMKKHLTEEHSSRLFRNCSQFAPYTDESSDEFDNYLETEEFYVKVQHFYFQCDVRFNKNTTLSTVKVQIVNQKGVKNNFMLHLFEHSTFSKQFKGDCEFTTSPFFTLHFIVQ